MKHSFDNHFEEVDREISRMKKWTVVTSIFALIIFLGLVSFGIWVIIVLLQFFSVI